MKEYEHYISKRIKQIYRKRILFPAVFLCALLVCCVLLDIFSVVFPKPLDPAKPKKYVTVSMSDLRFTGYTESVLGRTNGYYYYTVVNGECCLVLLSPATAFGGITKIPELTLRCERVPCSEVQRDVLKRVFQDLNLPYMRGVTGFSGWFFDEPDYHYGAGQLAFILSFLFFLYALYELITCILIIRRPYLSPSIRQLRRFGDPKRLLKEAEEELMTLPQLATEDLFITEHFFIEVADSEVAVIPIQEIVWIYKYSALHKILWYHFSITYTLSITARQHIYLQCPKNIKSDIDGIMDYLAEANHNILVGFSEANRQQVQKLQGTPMQLDKLLAFLNQRI